MVPTSISRRVVQACIVSHVLAAGTTRPANYASGTRVVLHVVILVVAHVSTETICTQKLQRSV
jgi:hypothetical protein